MVLKELQEGQRCGRWVQGGACGLVEGRASWACKGGEQAQVELGRPRSHCIESCLGYRQQVTENTEVEGAAGVRRLRWR